MLLVRRVATILFAFPATRVKIFHKASKWARLAARSIHSSTGKIERIEVTTTQDRNNFFATFARQPCMYGTAITPATKHATMTFARIASHQETNR